MTATNIKMFAFAAWQESRGASSLEESGPSWERFSSWWSTHYGYIADVADEDLAVDAVELDYWQGNTICEIAGRAWDEARRDRFTAWWTMVVANSKAKP